MGRAKQVHIPFLKDWREDMLNDRKVCTSRPKKYGKVGDWFEAFGSRFVIIDILTLSLEVVAVHYYALEGCDSPEQFIQVWQRLHLRKGFVPGQEVYLHRFAKDEEAPRGRERGPVLQQLRMPGF